MANLAALLAAVFSLSAKNRTGGLKSTPPPAGARVKVLGQPVTPKNGQNATSPMTSCLSKLEPRFKDQNAPYGLRNTMGCLLGPCGPF